jgi:type VI secretion system protein ImpA
VLGECYPITVDLLLERLVFRHRKSPMASPPTIDIERLLQPISNDAPCGAALKEDSTTAPLYYEVKDAREAARAAERAGARGGDDSERRAEKPDWDRVVRLASSALHDKSKDLWIAAWLLEGLVRLHGFAGLRDGFRLVRELCERYFECIHPRPDDDGIATTVAQLSGLNGEGAEGALIAPIAAIPITQGTSVGPLTGRDYADAESVARTADPDSRAKRVASGAPTLDMFEAAARETSPEFFRELRDDVSAAIEEFDRLTIVLAEKCGTDVNGYSAAPPSSKIAAALAESLARVRALAGEPAAEETTLEGDGVQTGKGGGLGGTSNISGREDAFQQLLKVAEFFRRTEPHSPVSYALEQAVRWGRMPLPELIRELVADDSVRRDLFRRTGMRLEEE